MKSIITEGSSVEKAIRNAWERAGKPSEFSIKVLEGPVKNFFGWTKVSAKIALFFGFKKGIREKQEPKVSFQEAKRSSRPKKFVEKKESVESQKTIGVKFTEKTSLKSKQRISRKPLWNKEIVSHASNVLINTLKNMNLSVPKFTIEPSGIHLRIKFERPVLEDKIKEKKLFASLAHLILEALKIKFNSSFRNHKIVLTN